VKYFGPDFNVGYCDENDEPLIENVEC
jgi:hypothetical protein